MMSHIRKRSEKWEQDHLSEFAALSSKSEGRQKKEEPCDIRTCYQRDRDRIIHAKAFRRLKQKTQVFIAPEEDHFRTRLTHTLEVAQISRTIARALCLNEDLTEAIALGHDLGHTPFGHSGEEVLNRLVAGGFRHNEQSLRVVDHYERENGLNLTSEVRDGILWHTGTKKPFTLEGRIVRTADRIAYINHDIDDAIRSGIIKGKDLPKDCVTVLGQNHGQRIDTMVKDMITESENKNDIEMSRPVSEAMDCLRDYLFRNVYIGSAAKTEEDKAKKIIEYLFHYYLDNAEELPAEYGKSNDIMVNVCDYLSGMTDRYAVHQFEKLFIPKGFQQIN